MKQYVKRFRELTTEELYRILRLRVAVFVVEQNCPYMEIDDLDQAAIHVWLEDEDGIEAYLRVLDRGAESEYCAIGRVLAAGIWAAQELFDADAIYLEAQTYARGLYEKQGFRQISEEFLLDGIPHIKMLRASEVQREKA